MPQIRDSPGIPTDAILARKRDSAAIGQQNAQLRAASDGLEWVVTTYAVTFGGRWRLIERLPKSWKS